MSQTYQTHGGIVDTGYISILTILIQTLLVEITIYLLYCYSLVFLLEDFVGSMYTLFLLYKFGSIMYLDRSY